MFRPVFAVFVALALLGDARIFLFVMNRFVYGSHRQEKSPWQWLFYVVPPLLLVLTLLFWPLSQWLNRLEDVELSPAVARIGATWLIAAAAVGTYWVLERIRINAFGEPPIAGIRTSPPAVIAMRRAHVPFAWVRRLGAHNDIYDLEVTKHELFIDDLPPAFDGYRIAFLTDTHVGSFMRQTFYEEVIRQTHAFDPDAIILGGDLVTFHNDISLMVKLWMQLRARDGVFAILGNHDYWAGGEEIVERLSACGVQYVINRSVTLTRGGDALAIAGIDEMYRGAPDVDRALDGIHGPCIAVSHHPDIIDLLGAHRIDLLLCGHTHGGQIRFPFFGAVVVPSAHETAYASGFHRVRNVLMYVSRGIGGVPPLRILCRPEVATFTLRRGQRTE